jgi:hypothetical protein
MVDPAGMLPLPSVFSLEEVQRSLAECAAAAEHESEHKGRERKVIAVVLQYPHHV